MALTRGNYRDDRNGCWGNDGFMEIFFLFFLLAWGGGGFFGGGWGNNGMNGSALQGALTRSDLMEGFNNQEVISKLNNLGDGICSSTYALNNTIRDNGMYMMQGFGGVERQLAQNGYEQQNCCCEIKQAIHAEGEATRALINANEMQNLRDRLEARDREVMIRDFQLSQLSQTANIIETVRPFPVPAYVTCSPYTSNLPLNAYGYNGYYGNGNGCCYGN